MKKTTFRRAVSALLSAAIMLGMCACSDGTGTGKKVFLSDSTTDLMANVEPSAKALAFKKDEDRQRVFKQEYRDFAFTLFKQCAAESPKENTLVSPLSVMTALAMTANGAKGETLRQMHQALSGVTYSLDSVTPMDVEELNRYLGAYQKNLPSSDKARFASANAIWLKEHSLDFKKDFLQTNADYYGADVFESKFDEKTLADINNWVKENTDGMIPQVLDEIPVTTVMYLINALSFDAEWKEIYREDQVYDGEFTDIDGKRQHASMMSSTESVYLNDGKAQGFVKPYAADYSFVAMLPEEGVSLDNYIASLNFGQIAEQIQEENHESVLVSLPKFSANYSTELSGILKQEGMTDAFDSGKADFSGMTDVLPGDLYINRVIHKTAIDVDERGTKAGAVTAVEMNTKGALMNAVYLDRPFVYMIVDNVNCLPIFIGQVTHIG